MLLVGLARLGNDPVVRYTPDNKPVMDLSLAFSYGKKGPDGKRPTQWVSATMWGDRVEKLSQHLIKGQQLFVTLGEPHIEDYDRKDGTKGTSLRARLNELEFAGAAQNNQPKPKDVIFDDLEDDIPF
jgi:single-strand DNA-binding protein